MKKYLTILISAILLFALAACGNSQNKSEALQPNVVDNQDVTDEPEIADEPDVSDKLDFANINNQLFSLTTILNAAETEDILSMFADSSIAENGNLIIDGEFSNINGSYEVCCWENRAYQIIFIWDEDSDFSPSEIISDVNSCIGEYVDHNKAWDIYTWENDNIEISFRVEDGIWIESIFDEGYSENDVSAVSKISDNDYVSLAKDSIENDIRTIKRMMTYRNKPKSEVFIDYSDLVDDDWNQLVMPGCMFGINGQYIFMYDRDSGLIDSVAFDWVPDDMEKHETHMVYCVKEYFGGHFKQNSTKGNGLTYYYHDWDATTDENWSVHLSMTNESGWLQFSQLKTDRPNPPKNVCIECNREATDTYTNPFSNQVEHYCYSHYKEIIDTFGAMEQDVANSNYSKHTCMECGREGTHRYDSFTGQTEYYCTIHYEELMDMLSELGIK